MAADTPGVRRARSTRPREAEAARCRPPRPRRVRAALADDAALARRALQPGVPDRGEEARRRADGRRRRRPRRASPSTSCSQRPPRTAARRRRSVRRALRARAARARTSTLTTAVPIDDAKAEEPARAARGGDRTAITLRASSIRRSSAASSCACATACVDASVRRPARGPAPRPHQRPTRLHPEETRVEAPPRRDRIDPQGPDRRLPGRPPASRRSAPSSQVGDGIARVYGLDELRRARDAASSRTA